MLIRGGFASSRSAKIFTTLGRRETNHFGFYVWTDEDGLAKDEQRQLICQATESPLSLRSPSVRRWFIILCSINKTTKL